MMVREVSDNAGFMLTSPAYERRRNKTFTGEDTYLNANHPFFFTLFNVKKLIVA